MEDSLFESRLNNHDILINGLVKSQAKLEDNLIVITDILKRVVEQQEQHSIELKRINDRLDAQEGQIKILIEQFMSGFNLETMRNMMDEINAKFDRVFERLDAHDAKFDRVFERLDAHDAKFDQMMERLDANDARFEEQRQASDAKFDRVFERLDARDAKFAEQDTKFTQITEELHTIRSILEAIVKKLEI